MKKGFKRKVALLMALMLGLTACGSGGGSDNSSKSGDSSTDGKIDTSKEVKVTMHVMGDPPTDSTPLEELSKKMKEEVNADFEIVCLGWDNSAFDLLFSSGEAFDLVYVGAGSYASYVRDGSLLPLKELLPEYAPESWKNTPETAWKQAEIDGEIYAVPNRFTEFIPSGIEYRGDWLKKYNMDELASIEDMEKYFDNVIKEENITPFEPDTGWNAYYMVDLFLNTTKNWIIPSEVVTGLGIAAALDKPEEIFAPAFTDEFMDFAKRMKEWDTKGYWSKDVLSTTANPSGDFLAGKTAAYINHAQGYIGTYGSVLESLPDCDPLFYCFSEAEKKIPQQPALANSTAISRTSENPERSLMVLDLLLNDKEINNLCQYGIKGKNYDIDAEGCITRPESFDESKDLYSIGTWALNVDEFCLPSTLDHPEKAEINAELKSISYESPYVSVPFDASDISNEVAAVNQVNSQLGTQIMFGKVDDPEAAVEEYREQLKAAGIDTIVEEYNAQYKEYLANK